MSYIPRAKLEFIKHVVKLRQNTFNCSCCASANVSISSPALRVQTRLLSTSLQTQPEHEGRKVAQVDVVVIDSENLNKEEGEKYVDTGNEVLQIPPSRPRKKQETVCKANGLINPAKKIGNHKNIKISQIERERSAKIKLSEMERVARELSLNKSLISYMELTVFNGDLSKAHKTLNYYRAKLLKSSGQRGFIDIQVYNILLHGYAAEKNLLKVKEVFSHMVEDALSPSPQTYAAVLECLGRLKHTSSGLRNIRNTIQTLKQSGYTEHDLFNKCSYIGDQKECVLIALRRIEKEFSPKIEKPSSGYICSLLKPLNLGRYKSRETQHYISPGRGLISTEELRMKVDEQMNNELQGKITIKSIERQDCEENTALFRKTLEQLEKNWATAIAAVLDRNLKNLQLKTERNQHPYSMNLYPFLKVLDPQEFVNIISLEIRKLAEGSETYSPTLNYLYRGLGLKVLSRYQILHKERSGILNKIDGLYKQYVDWYLTPELYPAVNTRQRWQEFIYDPESEGPDIDVKEKEWTSGVLSNIGRFLYEIIMRDIKIDANVMKIGSKSVQMVPAFYSIFRMQGVYLKEEIKPHPALVKLFQAASRDELTFETSLVPMVCPPLPWASIRTGGYLLSAAKIVRLPFQAHQQLCRLESCPPEQLYPALDSLNQLGGIPWKINEDVLDVIIEVFNNNGNELIGIPPPPSECPAPPAIEPNMTKQDYIAAHKQRLVLRRRKAEMYSLWCDSLYKFSLANHFRKSIFWLPHNMDFRGRVYPCPPHLSHLNADAGRSILVFAKGFPLGFNGLNWLKIHVINLTGLKKRDSVAVRLQYANEIIDDILDSARNPLTGKKWWMESDEPWQTLAGCMEIDKALKSGNPESFVSHYPIHQDGSCNGLQHYAALGRDEAGAESVNLSPCDTPQDVYSSVAVLVEKQRAEDAEKGMKIAQALEGFIKRKVIKQTVMTTVYGVTRFGARQQIAKQLKDMPDFPKELIWGASMYLTATTFVSLQEMFTSTKEIQDWFTECARLISQVCGQNVEWVTPLGLPVVQPYFKNTKKLNSAYNPAKLPEVHVYDMYERPNVMKQKNAFPPNYIHSLDSSHMMLTSLYCERTGMTFVSVHDCFWTHPITVETMNRICRQQFVALHSEPILEDLSKFLVEKYSYKQRDLLRDGTAIDAAKTRLNQLLKEVPPKGKFDLRNVLTSVYFFS